MLRKYLFYFIVLIIAGCETNPPENFEIPAVHVKLFVSSDVSGAEILIDHITTGKFTPDTITLNSGEHLLSLFKEGFVKKDTIITIVPGTVNSIHLLMQASVVKKIVLLEDFANVSCNPCVISNQILQSLENGIYKDKIAIIKFPTNWPGANDPFYLSAKAEADARINFYRVNVAPTIIVDGTAKPSPQDSNKVKLAIDAELNKDAKFKIEVVDSINGDYLHADVYVTVIDTGGLDFSQLVLHTAVIETEIEFSTPPGSNGETRFYNVIRTMYPSPEGEALNNYNFEYHRGITCSSSWNKSRIKTVAFIQNKVTKEIYQAGY